MQRSSKLKNLNKFDVTGSGIKLKRTHNPDDFANGCFFLWLNSLEKQSDSVSFSRGKTYAHQGRVSHIRIERGVVTAFVRGTREKPYQIKLGVHPITDEQINLLLFKFRENASYAAKLLAYEMPKDIEMIFQEIGIEFFLSKEAFSRYKCSCPDTMIPCKHIIAVLLLMANEIEKNPFLLFQLYGLDKKRLLKRLTEETRSRNYDYENEDFDSWLLGETNNYICGGEDEFDRDETKSEEECLLIEKWYKRGKKPVFFAEEKEGKDIMALKKMKDFPFWKGEKTFFKTIFPYYEKAMDKALKFFAGGRNKSVGRPKKHK